MNLFYYAPRPGEKGDELLRSARSLVRPGSLEVFEKLDKFGERMRRLKDPLSVAMIIKPSRKDLQFLAEMRDFMRETRVLLVLSNQKRETISLALRVFPTFVAYSGEDLPGLLSVLRQLTKIQNEDAFVSSDSP
jgi:hypothetical protein